MAGNYVKRQDENPNSKVFNSKNNKGGSDPKLNPRDYKKGFPANMQIKIRRRSFNRQCKRFGSGESRVTDVLERFNV